MSRIRSLSATHKSAIIIRLLTLGSLLNAFTSPFIFFSLRPLDGISMDFWQMREKENMTWNNIGKYIKNLLILFLVIIKMIKSQYAL